MGRSFLGITALKIVLSVFVLCLTTLAAQAQCVQPGDIARGVVFSRESTGAGTAIQSGKFIQINYEPQRAGSTHTQVATLGIYPRQTEVGDAPPGVIGAFYHASSTWNLQGNPPKPSPGKSWSTGATLKRKVDDHSGSYNENGRYRVAYSFEAPRQANLGGCGYSVIGVTARFVGQSQDYTNRYAYFPDLGFGLMTQYIDNKTGSGTRYGVLSMKPAR